MNFVSKLERKFGKFAIKNLMYYIIGIYVIGFALEVFAPYVYNQYLSLNVSAILQGQVWRIVTFIMQPPSSGLLFMIISMYFYYIIGSVLEKIWGAFRFNLYYFSGVILHVIAAFIIHFVFGVDFQMSTYYINLALFMAFAVENADTTVLLFFVIPIKIKWLAIFDAVLFGITIIGGYLTPIMPIVIWQGLYNLGFLAGSIYACYVSATCALVSMLNFIVFFILYKKGPIKNKTQKNFEKAMKAYKKANQGRGTTTPLKTPSDKGNTSGFRMAANRHKCAVCGRTEADGADLVFRYCSKCQGNYEYCQEHLYTHIHVGSNGPK